MRMKSIIALLFIAMSAIAQPRPAVITDTNGVLLAHTNFFGANTNAMYQALRPLVSGSGSITNAHDSVVAVAGNQGVTAGAVESVLLGYVAGSYASNAVSDVFIGTGAGRYAADAVGSTFIGAYAGRNATNNTESVFIGKYAGESVTRPNTFIVSGTVADVGTNSLIYGEFDNGLLRVNGNLDVTGTITGNGAGLTNVGTSGALTNGDVRDITFAGAVYGQDATATNGFVTLQQLASSIGSTYTMWASTNTGFLAGYYNALMEPPTHPTATITVAGVTNGQILAQWTSDTNMASVIRAGIGSIASRQRITSAVGNHALTVMPAFYIRHANASETAIDSAQSIPLSDVLTDYNTEFMVSSNMNVLATDRMVVRWVATSVGNTPTWQFECGSTVYGIVVNFPVVTAMTGGYLTNNDSRSVSLAGGLYSTVLHSPPTDWGTVFRSATDETETLIYSELDNSWVFPVNVILQGSVTGSGDQLTNSAGYRISSMADTNWVLAQIASLGAHVYATGVTNTQGVLTLTNKSQGWASVPTTVTTNTVSAAAGQYVRSVVSTNTFARFESGPISIEAYAFRVGAVATSVSFHPEIYIYDPILSNLVKVATAPPQVCQSNTPVLFDFSVSIPTSFVPTNASHIVWAWKIDSTNGTPTSLNFVSGGAYDSHLSFSVPASLSLSYTIPIGATLTNPIIYAGTNSSFPVRFATNNGTMMVGGYDKIYDLSTYSMFVQGAAHFNGTIYGTPGNGLSFGGFHGSITAPAAGQLKASTSFLVASNILSGGGIYTGTNSGAGTVNYVTNNLGGKTIVSSLEFTTSTASPTNITSGRAYIFSKAGTTNAGVNELFVAGGDGVETQISPHADDAPPQLYDKATGDMKEIIWRESNPYITNGLVSFINMRRMARTMELQTRVLLLLCGTTNASTTAAAARLKAMTVAEKQVLMTEDYPTYNARTGNNLQPLDWDVIQTRVQATYDMQRANVDLQRTYLSETNAVIQAQIDAGDTNVTLVPLPDALPVRNVKQAKPGWMK